MATPSNNDNTTSNARIHQVMSAEMFANLGAPDLAYVRPITTEHGDVWGVFSANGTQLGWAPQRDLAFAAAVQNELMAVSVH